MKIERDRDRVRTVDFCCRVTIVGLSLGAGGMAAFDGRPTPRRSPGHGKITASAARRRLNDCAKKGPAKAR
jgi:hypothetical protein